MLYKVQSTIKDQALLNQKRTLLCQIAAKKFLEKGYERTTMPDIADAAGISIGSIYRYIGKKEDILTLLLQYMCKLVNDELAPVSLLELEPEEKLNMLFSKYCNISDKYRRYFVVAIRENRSMNTSQRQVLWEIENSITSCFTRTINEGSAKGIFDSSLDEFFAYNLLILGQQWTMRNYHYKDLSLEDFIDRQLEIIKSCLSPQ